MRKRGCQLEVYKMLNGYEDIYIFFYNKDTRITRQHNAGYVGYEKEIILSEDNIYGLY